MKNTYTYTARSAHDPEKIVTFTLHDDRMSVGTGAPLEQVMNFVESFKAEEEAAKPHIWLRPLAIALAERGTKPFRVEDVDARAEEDWLQIKGWVRVGGLRLSPITLMEGTVDNAIAAQAFVKEVQARKTALAELPAFLKILDYWLTWFAAGTFLLTLLQFWRSQKQDT
jgi:hypothetical protein